MLNLNEFMNSGIMNIAETAGRFYLGNLRGQEFMFSMIMNIRKSANIRKQYEKNGTHIPPFLISSISTKCNLHCAGCYARANGGCVDKTSDALMQLDEWKRVFTEASEIGISFILLAGGEPLLRRDIIELAAQFDNIIFPIFTNGTMLDENYLSLFDKHRNLIPVLSIEGNELKTDERRGKGVSDLVWNAANELNKKGILFGTSITVTKENKNEVTEKEFVHSLQERGCGLIFYVEYVPAEANTEHLILSDDDLKDLQERIDLLKSDKKNKGMIILSFPGDEDKMGGCLAAGRGFFHINANGNAEPCPFSPYSEINMKNQSVIEVLQSEFFNEVRKISMSEAINHKGGCLLFQYADKVENALQV